MGPLSCYDLSFSPSRDKARPGGNYRSLSSQKSISFLSWFLQKRPQPVCLVAMDATYLARVAND